MNADSSASDFQSGQVIADHYRLERPIGSGGMASVWEAVDLHLGQTVAVKFLASSLIVSGEAHARFEREIAAISSLDSPFVVRVLDYGIAEGSQPFMVLEHLNGRDLGDVLASGERLSIDDVVRIVQQVCGALACAHSAGVVHRDIKPANIFLTERDAEPIAKVLDFGIALVDGQAQGGRALTRPDEILGTLEYISPEQLLGQGAIDGRADLYGLGVVAYRCLTGVVPFPGETLGELLLSFTQRAPPTPSSIRSELPKEFDEWMARALAHDRDKRFQNPEEMAASLGKAMVSARPHPTAGPLSGTSSSTARPAPARDPTPSWVDRAEAPPVDGDGPGVLRTTPPEDSVVLPSRVSLVARRAASRLEYVAPRWLSPFFQPAGRTREQVARAVLLRAGRDFRQSLVDHRGIWLIATAMVVATVAIVVLFLSLG